MTCVFPVLVNGNGFINTTRWCVSMALWTTTRKINQHIDFIGLKYSDFYTQLVRVFH